MGFDGRWEQDARILRILDDGLTEARRRAGDAATCRSGCFGCCLGPFPITMQDAERLRRGLSEMESTAPDRGARIRQRAAEAALALRTDFPGDWSTGMLDPSRTDELYASRFEMIPCPALELESGACELYPHRPVACRTFGLAVRVGGIDLTPCGLNYAGMSKQEIEARRVELHLDAIDGADLEDGQTTVATALR